MAPFLRLCTLLGSLFLFLTYADVCVYEPESRCQDESCGLPIYDPDVQVPCNPCGESNIGSGFGDCINGARTLHYFWKPPAICTGGVSLPDPVPGIPCGLSCPLGTFLNTTSLSCISCGPGTYSGGDGHYWDEWHHWPGQFITYCSTGYWSHSNINPLCEPWQLNGETIDSGNQHLQDYMVSNLELRVHVIKPGNLTFQYKVSAEAIFDYLNFIVDDLSYFTVSNSDWAVYNFRLQPGYHTIKWQYYKDISLTRGDDKVTIRSIYINGLTMAQPSCTKCPPGHFSNDTAGYKCYPCAAGTYSDSPGASFCQPCAAGTYSLEGASSCIPNSPCSTSPNNSDITYSYTPCVGGVRTKVYQWIQPTECDSHSVNLPPNEQSSCSSRLCLPGEYLDPTNSDRCLYCSSGTYSFGGQASSCSQCNVGYSTNQVVQHFSNWTAWDPAIATGCDGFSCLTNGWRTGVWFTDSGYGHGDGADSWIQLTTVLNPGSVVWLDYALPCNIESDLIFSINGSITQVYNCDGTSISPFRNSSYFVSFLNPPNTPYVLRWTYEQRGSPLTNNTNRAIIREIRITGVGSFPSIPTGGGASNCSLCRSGTFSNSTGLAQCYLCPAGSSSSLGSSQCSTCGTGNITDVDGSPVCLSCGNGTTSNTQHTKCTFDCTNVGGFQSGHSYNLASLGQWNLVYTSTSGNITDFSWNSSASVCDWNPSCSNAYICVESDEVPIRNRNLVGVGKIVSFEEISANQNGVILHYAGEAGCSAHLYVKCDPGADSGTPVLAQPFNSVSCVLNATWNSKYGCAKCTPQDFQFVDSPCNPSNGGYYITRTYYQINPYCYGGTSLPAPQQSMCSCQTNNPCDPLTTCIDYFGGTNCTACPPKYSGTGSTGCRAICDNPCQNGGVCAFPNVCSCINTPYTGPTCTTPICNPGCVNGGRCVRPNVCDCSSTGYNGTVCQIALCDPMCQNGGICAASNVCDCTSTGKVGPLCDVDAANGVSPGVVAALSIVGVVVMVLAVTALAILYSRHRKLYAQYSKLSSNIPLDEE